MKECENCSRMLIESHGQPSTQQLETMGNPDVKPWCKICKELMISNYKLRQQLSAESNPFNSRHSGSPNNGFSRFDV